MSNRGLSFYNRIGLDTIKQGNLYKSPYDERDYLVRSFLDLKQEVPPIIDYTNEMSPVKYQGSEGACAGFAGVAVKEWMEIKDYNLTPKTYIDLSERYLYEKAKEISGHSNGTTLVAIAKALREYGVCEERFWIYIANVKGKPLEGTDENAQRFKVHPTIYARITNERELKLALLKYGPLPIAVYVWKNWYRQKDGHIPDKRRWEISPLGAHGIALVKSNDYTKEYKWKNSWGPNWGDVGYGYITYKHMREALMDAIVMIDIDDPKEYEGKQILTVADLTKEELKTAWV